MSACQLMMERSERSGSNLCPGYQRPMGQCDHPADPREVSSADFLFLNESLCAEVVHKCPCSIFASLHYGLAINSIRYIVIEITALLENLLYKLYVNSSINNIDTFKKLFT